MAWWKFGENRRWGAEMAPGGASIVVDRAIRQSWGLALCWLLIGCTSAPAAVSLPPSGPAPVAAWGAVAPESQGFDSMILADALPAVGRGAAPPHEVVLVRQGGVVLDAAFYPYDGTTPHQVGSATRTVVAILLGIAIDRGLVALDDPVLSFFPDRSIANRDDLKERMTLRHLATMTTGLDCTAANGEATLREMLASRDWVGYTLDLPMTAEPGRAFRFCSPAAHLLSAVLEAVTGVSTLEFARQYLFEPLGISNVRWAADPQGVTDGWSNLYLLPRDLARIGTVWQQGGAWDGRPIVSERWVRAAAEGRISTGGQADYGLGWWVPPDATEGTVEAIAQDGQHVLVRPDLGLVAVTAGAGIDTSRILDPLLAALVSADRPLFADPLGEQELADALEAARSGPEAVRPSAPASTVKAVSGVTWVLDANPPDLTSLRLDLTAKGAQGTVTMAYGDSPIDDVLPVGLDGRYRVGLDRHRRPVAIRASWAAGRTIVLELDEVADGRAYELRLSFGKTGNAVTVEGTERGHDASFVIEGRPTG